MLFVVMAVSVSAQPSVAQSNSESNERVLIKVLASELRDLPKSSEQPPYFLDIRAPRSISIMLVEQLVNSGFSMSAEAEGAYKLTIVPETGFQIEKTSRKQAFRRLTGNISWQITDTDNGIIAAGSGEPSYKDTIAVEQIETFDSNWKPAKNQATTESGKRKGWRKLVQPALIVAAAGTTVFLLFNVRQ